MVRLSTSLRLPATRDSLDPLDPGIIHWSKKPVSTSRRNTPLPRLTKARRRMGSKLAKSHKPSVMGMRLMTLVARALFGSRDTESMSLGRSRQHNEPGAVSEEHSGTPDICAQALLPPRPRVPHRQKTHARAHKFGHEPKLQQQECHEKHHRECVAQNGTQLGETATRLLNAAEFRPPSGPSAPPRRPIRHRVACQGRQKTTVQEGDPLWSRRWSAMDDRW